MRSTERVALLLDVGAARRALPRIIDQHRSRQIRRPSLTLQLQPLAPRHRARKRPQDRQRPEANNKGAFLELTNPAPAGFFLEMLTGPMAGSSTAVMHGRLVGARQTTRECFETFSDLPKFSSRAQIKSVI
jgi:hypothetical protein